MKLTFIVLTIFSSILFTHSTGQLTHNCRRLHRHCAFKFAHETSGHPQVYNPLSAGSDQPFTPLIVSKNPHVRLGVLNMNGISPRLVFRYRTFPITHFGHPRFTPTHIKPIPIKGTFGSGLALQALDGNQKRAGKRRCVIVWFTQYQLLTRGHEPRVIANLVAKKRDMKCVVFLTPY